jgi:hypothetical protein
VVLALLVTIVPLVQLSKYLVLQAIIVQLLVYLLSLLYAHLDIIASEVLQERILLALQYTLELFVLLAATVLQVLQVLFHAQQALILQVLEEQL